MAEEQENELVPEEEVTSIPGWAPTVSLQVQDIRTGEEEEEEVYSQRSKLYRFKDGDWKERGLGDSKLLRHKVSGKVRYMMRQEKTGKIVANHFVFEHQLYCVLANQNQSDKILMWTALDYAEDEQHAEQFALKFKDKELAEMFRTAFDRAKVGQTSGSPKADGPGPPPSEPHSEPHGSPTPPAQAAAEGVEDELVPEEEVTVVPGWAPTVTLQPQEIRTGEEDEDEIYSQRSKLYRFKDSDWKERGLGDSKLLRNRVTGKVRYMMRQEKTGKIVANHYLIAYPPYCELAPNAGSDKIWTWTTIDCAEDEQKVEQFSLRFKDADLAQQFKTAFNSARAEMAEVYTPEPKTNDSEAAAGDAAAVGVSPESDAGENGNPFAGVSLFAASPLQSSGTALTGGATSGGLFSSLSSTGSVASSSGLFSTTAATSGGSLFSSSSASASSGLFGGGLFASANTAGGLFSGMSFGSNKADPPESQAQVESKPTSSEAAAPFASLTFAASTGGLFGNTAGSFFSGSGSLFGNSGNSSSSGGGLFSGSTGGASGGLFAGLPESSSGGIFGGGSIATTGSSLFGLAASSGSLFSAASGGGIQGAAATGAAEKAPSTGLWAGATANGAQDDEQYVFEEEVTQIPGWAPSVSLEVRDHVETGEEDEEEMYSQRSKLLRFVENEWKERGTGDAKILRHGGTGKCRFLMRQEKTAKIVANHYIIDQHPYCDLVHNAGNAKIWVWTALDWADEEQKVEKFALRFKTEELADEFAKAFNAAKSGEMTSVGDAQDDDDWEKAEAEAYGAGALGEGPGDLAALAAMQATSGWRCDGCRLQWSEQDLECNVCEIVRPGYESEVAAAKAEKESGKQSAVAAFLGATQSSGTGSFAQSSSSTATGIVFGFGSAAPAAPSAATAQPSPSIFGANPSSSSIFGGSTSTFDASYASCSSGAAAKGTATGFGGAASQGSSTTAMPESIPSPPVATPPPAGQDFAGCGQGAYSGYPCAQQFSMPHIQSCMAQLGMAGMMGGPGMCGYGAAQSPEGSRVEALERTIKEMQEKLKDLRDSLDNERQERSKVEFRLQCAERRLQDEESRSSRAEARVAAVEAAAMKQEALVEGLRHQLERSQPTDDTRLVNALQKNLEEQLAPLRRGLEQKSSEEMRLLTKVVEQADSNTALKQRLEALEGRLDRMGLDLPVMTIRPPPERASYFQALQVQQSGRRLANGCEDESRQGTVHLVDPKPLLRRIP